MSGPLSGVKVLDLSRLLPGPACTWYLQGMGAQVDRVETPGAGDLTRHIPPYVDGVGAMFAAISQGKRSVALDLRNPVAVAVVRRLLPHYDVLVEGFRPGVMEQMGLDPKELLALQPRLIIARLSGYGQTGPLAELAGHDLNYVGMTGAIAAGSHVDGSPAVLPVQVADFSSALVAAMGISAALFERERTGRGRILDISLAESALSLVAPQIAGFSAEQRDPQPGGEILTGGVPIYGTYVCADGKFLTLGAIEGKFQASVAAEIGPLLHREELASVFRTRTRDEWVERLGQACVGPVLSFQEAAAHPLFLARGAVERLAKATFVRPPFSEGPAGAVPGLGEHNDAVLADAGLDEHERETARKAGIHG